MTLFNTQDGIQLDIGVTARRLNALEAAIFSGSGQFNTGAGLQLDAALTSRRLNALEAYASILNPQFNTQAGLAIDAGTTSKRLNALELFASMQAFSPLNLFAAGQQGAWYDPSDLSTLFQDSAGTTPVTAVGQSVGLMRDKSGRANHASQATAGNRPVFQQDVNGNYYLVLNGTSSAMGTAAIDFTATNKMTVWAGVNKQSDAALGMFLEMSANYNSNLGSLYMSVPSSSSMSNYALGVHGTAVVAELVGTSPFPVNSSSIITAQIDLAAPFASLRRNTVADTSSVAAMGGNFGNYPLYMGARAGASLFFNGRMYGLIVRGAQSSAVEISNAETYMNSKTKAY